MDATIIYNVDIRNMCATYSLIKFIQLVFDVCDLRKYFPSRAIPIYMFKMNLVLRLTQNELIRSYSVTRTHWCMQYLEKREENFWLVDRVDLKQYGH